jgi:uncharacterized protein
MICLYHGIDLDGWCSAAIIQEKYPDCKLIPYNYGRSIADLPTDEDVILVDISVSMETFRKYLEEGRRVVWIDHHLSAIRTFDSDLRYDVQNNKNFKFSLDPKKAACELTWEYINPNKKMPEAVRLLGRYDCFGHIGTAEEFAVLTFQLAARAKWFDPKTAVQALRISNEEIAQMTVDGLAIYNYLKVEADLAYKNLGFPLVIEGYKFIAFNKDRFNPINFDLNYNKDGYDGAASFHYADKRWNFSLYSMSPDVDCSVICKKLGGGGHKGAAGFVTQNIELYVKT